MKNLLQTSQPHIESRFALQWHRQSEPAEFMAHQEEGSFIYIFIYIYMCVDVYIHTVETRKKALAKCHSIAYPN